MYSSPTSRKTYVLAGRDRPPIITPLQNNGLGIRVEEGDVLYASEGDVNDDFLEVTCGERTGRLPVSYGSTAVLWWL